MCREVDERVLKELLIIMLLFIRLEDKMALSASKIAYVSAIYILEQDSSWKR